MHLIMDTNPVLLNKPWMNYSKNVVAGWTVTVTARHGGIIISALTLFVQMAGESLWSIVAFAMHQLRACDVPGSALFRQLQVILRNPGNALNTVFEIIEVAWVWHGHIRRPFRDCLAVGSVPLVIFASFTIAGLFVNSITVSPGDINQVLLQPTDCGLQNWTPTDPSAFLSIKAKWSQDMRKSRAYASECYDVASESIGCSSLPIKQLPYTMITNASCPFAGGCLGAVSFDTGMLDSHKHLGINGKSDERVEFQFTTTCAVIDVGAYTTAKPDPESNSGYMRDTVYLGSVLGQNYTFQYSQMQTLQPTSYNLM